MISRNTLIHKDRTIAESITILMNTISVMSKRIDKLELEIEKLKENYELLDSKRRLQYKS